MSDYTHILRRINLHTHLQKQKALDDAWILMGNSKVRHEKKEFEQIDLFDFLRSENHDEIN